jgi:hypothetical protein
MTVECEALFNTKCADFGIYDWHKNRIVALVELDDATHDRHEERDAKRNAIALAADICAQARARRPRQLRRYATGFIRRSIDSRQVPADA